MKRFISMAMVAAMATSMVPATAFAGDRIDATARVVNSWTRKENFGLNVTNPNAPELQLAIKDAAIQSTSSKERNFDFTVELEGADFDMDNSGKLETSELTALEKGITIMLDRNGSSKSGTKYSYVVADKAQKEAALGIIYDNIVNGTNTTSGLEVDTADHAKAATTKGEELKTSTDVTKDNIQNYAAGYAAPMVTPGVAASDNELTAVTAWIEDVFPAAGATDIKSGQILVDGKVVPGYDFKEAAGNPQFVSTATVIDWIKGAKVDDTNTRNDKNTVKKSIADTLSDGKFVATAAKVDVNKADWVARELSKLNAGGGNDFFVENQKTMQATGANRDITASIMTEANTKDVSEVKVRITCKDGVLVNGDVITMDLLSVLDKAKDAYVSVTSDDFNISNAKEDIMYVNIEGEGITATTKKIGNVAKEEKANIEKDIEIKSTVGYFGEGQLIDLRLSNGFKFAKLDNKKNQNYTVVSYKNDEATIKVSKPNVDKLVIDAEDMVIEAKSANSGAVATLKIKAQYDSAIKDSFSASTSLEVMKVVDYTVTMSVDKDKDVPVIYSGVNVDNYGITDDSNHMSMEVTIKESFPGAWSMRKGFNLELPNGVYVTDVDVTGAAGFSYEMNGKTTTAKKNDWRDAFWNAYKDGDHKKFKFEKRLFNDVNTSLGKDAAEVTFKLEMVADPGFVGDVNLKLTGDLIDAQEVTIAKFATPFYIQAEQNDLKIDYRYTDIPTQIVVTEAEAGLWDADKAMFGFYIEKDLLTFEDNPKFTVDDASGMKLEKAEIRKIDLDNDGDKESVVAFTVDKESDKAAKVTISDMQLYMNRSIPAGPYDLKVATSMGAMYNQEVLFAPDASTATVVVADNDADVPAKPFVQKWATSANPFAARPTKSGTNAVKEDSYVKDVADFSEVAKEAFVNVVTAGREQDDASFTTKVVVPVGESYILAGETKVELDVPAYISAAGYTMLPVRAVATALGINNNNVIWNGETKTVTVLYGQRIITMVAGQKVVNVNGSAIPASAAVEIVNGRTFLPMRDLATALGVTDITWDAATKTATLNGGF